MPRASTAAWQEQSQIMRKESNLWCGYFACIHLMHATMHRCNYTQILYIQIHLHTYIHAIYNQLIITANWYTMSCSSNDHHYPSQTRKNNSLIALPLLINSIKQLNLRSCIGKTARHWSTIKFLDKLLFTKLSFDRKQRKEIKAT